MNRRDFIAGTLAATAGSTVVSRAAAGGFEMRAGTLGAPSAAQTGRSLALDRHRFGVNYTPSKSWWFCWNDWDAAPIKRDLDAIAALGMDHLRILLIWPYFQPNPKWVSPLHLERFDQLLTLMAERNLDAVVTALTGQLSGWFFIASF